MITLELSDKCIALEVGLGTQEPQRLVFLSSYEPFPPSPLPPSPRAGFSCCDVPRQARCERVGSNENVPQNVRFPLRPSMISCPEKKEKKKATSEDRSFPHSSRSSVAPHSPAVIPPFSWTSCPRFWPLSRAILRFDSYVYHVRCPAVAIDCSFLGNYCGEGGGVLGATTDTRITIEGGLFSGNRAADVSAPRNRRHHRRLSTVKGDGEKGRRGWRHRVGHSRGLTDLSVRVCVCVREGH